MGDNSGTSGAMSDIARATASPTYTCLPRADAICASRVPSALHKAFSSFESGNLPSDASDMTGAVGGATAPGLIQRCFGIRQTEQ